MAFQLPESLEGLTVQDLDALVEAARTDLNALGISEESSDDDLVAAEALVDAMAAVATQREATQTAADERQERIAKLAEAGKTEEVEAPAEAATEEVPEKEPELVEAAVEAITPDEVIDPAPVVEQETVAASSSPVQRAAENLPVDIAPTSPGVTLTAAANVPGTPDGMKLESLDDVVKVISNRIKAMPTHNLATREGGVRQRFGAVTVTRDPADESLVQGNSGNDWDLVERAADETRLEGGSLVAAASVVPGTGVSGWCSPSDTLYDFCSVESAEGMLDVPEFTVKRGGIRYTKGPNWADVYTDPSRSFDITNTPTGKPGSMVDALAMTDAGVQAGKGEAIGATAVPDKAPATITKKPCIMVPCFPWYEERLDASGLCVKSPILLESTYPELIKRFTEMVLVAHKHDMNRKRIAEIRAAAVANGGITTIEAFGDAGGTPATGGGASATGDVGAAAMGRTVFNLSAVEFAMMGLRNKYRMALQATIEIIAPTWLREVIRMDIALENGRQNRCVTDSEVDSWFSCRNARVQWVYDWQDLQDEADHLPSFPDDGSTAPTYTNTSMAPASVELLMYPAGTWSAGVSDIFNIDTVYDAASLADNVYTALFTEEAELMVQRCTETIGVKVPLCASGRGVLDDLKDCLTGK